jgi:hypothetical protein
MPTLASKPVTLNTSSYSPTKMPGNMGCEGLPEPRFWNETINRRTDYAILSILVLAIA